MGARNKEFNETEYKREYGKENYDRVTVYLPKGDRERIKRFAAIKRTTVNSLILSLLEKDIFDYCVETKQDYDRFCMMLSRDEEDKSFEA